MLFSIMLSLDSASCLISIVFPDLAANSVASKSWLSVPVPTINLYKNHSSMAVGLPPIRLNGGDPILCQASLQPGCGISCLLPPLDIVTLSERRGHEACATPGNCLVFSNTINRSFYSRVTYGVGVRCSANSILRRPSCSMGIVIGTSQNQWPPRLGATTTV